MNRFKRLPVAPLMTLLFAVLALAPHGAAQAADDAHKAAMQDFQANCSPCHGWGGAGDGPVASVLKVAPPDLTKIAQRNGGKFPTHAVLKMIDGTGMPQAHGTKQMPVWGGWFTFEAMAEALDTGDKSPVMEKVDARLHALVAYLESIQQ